MKLFSTLIATTSLALVTLAVPTGSDGIVKVTAGINNSKVYMINTVKDSTILHTTQSCPTCPSSDCNQCTKGAEQTLVVSSGGHAVNYALIGFTLPSETIQAPNRLDKCTFTMPQPNTPMTAPVTLGIASANPFWDEYSVNANNAPVIGNSIGSLYVPSSGAPASVDLTAACKAAAASGSGFSLYLTPASAAYLQFPSKEGGRPSYIEVTIH